jgi:hypothetical protein
MANTAGQKLSPPPHQPDSRWLQQLQQALNDAYAYACTTATRPPKPMLGFSLFDTSLGKPIWCKQAAPTVVWVDATGTVV